MHLALMYSLEPIFASLFSWYFTLEAFGPIRLTGAALLLGTCILSEWLANKRRQKAALVQVDATI